MTKVAARRIVAATLAVASLGPVARAEPQGSVERLLAAGESALARGDPGAALAAFEGAASMRHSEQIEVGIVRALMQAGEYRRALAFAGHTAFAHTESPAGAPLYVLLLRVGGQAQVAKQLLAGAQQRAPDDPSIQRALALVSLPISDSQVQALAPIVPTGRRVPSSAAMIGNATLLPDGHHALAPVATLPASGPLWLRDGRGRTVAAERERTDAASGLALLRLIDELPASAATAMTHRVGFPGSPAFVVAFGSSAHSGSSLPRLSIGFLGAATTDGGDRWLGVDAGSDSAGGPEFDPRGRLIGVVMPAQADARLRFSTLATLSTMADMGPSSVASPDAPNAGADEIYERGLRCALQVFASP